MRLSVCVYVCSVLLSSNQQAIAQARAELSRRMTLGDPAGTLLSLISDFAVLLLRFICQSFHVIF